MFNMLGLDELWEGISIWSMAIAHGPCQCATAVASWSEMEGCVDVVGANKSRKGGALPRRYPTMNQSKSSFPYARASGDLKIVAR